MNRLPWRNEAGYVLSVFFVLSLFLIMIVLLGADQSVLGVILLFLAYQLPWGLAWFFTQQKQWLFQALFMQKKDLPTLLAGVVLVVLFIALNGILGNIKWEGSFVTLILSLVQAICMGGLTQIGWRMYLQKRLVKRLGKKDLLFICVFLAVLSTAWYWLLSHVAWYIELPNLLLFFVFMLGHSFILSMVTQLSHSAIPAIVYHVLLQWMSSIFVVQFHVFPTILLCLAQVALTIYCFILLEK